MNGPIYVYYEIHGLYQNHRRCGKTKGLPGGGERYERYGQVGSSRDVASQGGKIC